jgi:hypothetical protein
MTNIKEYIIDLVDLIHLERYLTDVTYKDEVLTVTLKLDKYSRFSNLVFDELSIACKVKLKPYFQNIKVIIYKPPSEGLLKEYRF